VTLGKVVFYDYEHCREFLEGHARQLRDTSVGLNMLGLYRELFYGFTYEALENSAITLGQFDSGLVYMFVPEMLKREYYPTGHKVAREKALELMGCTKPPMVFEMVAAQIMDPPLPEKAHFDKWMRPEMLTLLKECAIEIHMYFNAHGFYEQILIPLLQKHGYTVADDYLTSARSGYLRVRHPQRQGKLFKLPWRNWIREMMTGGYSMAYLMACMGTYVQKMNLALKTTDAAPPETL
jgi:hypothetical protein